MPCAWPAFLLASPLHVFPPPPFRLKIISASWDCTFSISLGFKKVHFPKFHPFSSGSSSPSVHSSGFMFLFSLFISRHSQLSVFPSFFLSCFFFTINPWPLHWWYFISVFFWSSVLHPIARCVFSPRSHVPFLSTFLAARESIHAQVSSRRSDLCTFFSPTPLSTQTLCLAAAATTANTSWSQTVKILGDSPKSHSRSYQLPMLLPCRQQTAPGGQNVIGDLWALWVC